MSYPTLTPDFTVVEVIDGMYTVMKCRSGRKWGILNKTLLGFSFPGPPAIFESIQRTPWGGTLLELHAYHITSIQHSLGTASIYQVPIMFKIFFHLFLATVP